MRWSLAGGNGRGPTVASRMSFSDRVVGLIDYQAGNIQSIDNAFGHLGARTRRISRAADIEGVTHLLLPGVGAFGFCADRLRSTGLVERLQRWALDEGRPMLGICVGMQLMADIGEERGEHVGLGWIGGRIGAMTAVPPGIRVPHVGWNDVRFEQPFGSFAAGQSADFYFDHSFAYFSPVHGEVVGSCEHGERFCALVRRGKLVAAQFHPEKSQEAGLRLLAGFLELTP